ncbi:MAG: hypothetical protein C5B50_09415 [Verrucomicrobia bacterium]|nr:MAG: hypothetical protein C5B50_09415 [Verrucomicrobiota bacterium]
MLRLVLKLLVMFSLAAINVGCASHDPVLRIGGQIYKIDPQETRASDPALQLTNQIKAEQPRPGLAPNYTRADLTNNSVPILTERGPVLDAPLFKTYDKKLVDAILLHWYNLLDEDPRSWQRRSGEVVVEFRLHANGEVSDLGVTHNTSDALIDEAENAALTCLKAVQESAPFAPLPPEMRVLVGNVRRIQITFKYEP